MKKWCLAVGLFLAASVLPGLAVAQSFLVDRFANNAGPSGSIDQVVRIINVGKLGTPLSSPAGDICANMYIFDNNQEMIACCSCRLTPNELASASIGNELTSNPLTSVVPVAGVVKILPIVAGSLPCSPVAPFASPDASLVQASATHIEVSGPATYITETALFPASLGSDEASFLSNACLFVQYLGGGRGACRCKSPGN